MGWLANASSHTLVEINISSFLVKVNSPKKYYHYFVFSLLNDMFDWKTILSQEIYQV